MSLPVVTLRGDLTGLGFGAEIGWDASVPAVVTSHVGTPIDARTWTDYTAWLETGPAGAPISYAWGRQDNRGDVSAGTFDFLLNNVDGRFTTGASVIERDHLFQVQVTADGTTFDIITGYVLSVEPTWPGGVQSWSVVKVNCSDVTAKLEASQPLRSMYLQELLADAPAFLFPMDEPAGPESAGDISSNNVPASVLRHRKNIPGTATFGSDLGTFDGSQGVLFDNETSVSWLQTPLTLPQTGAFALSAVVMQAEAVTSYVVNQRRNDFGLEFSVVAGYDGIFIAITKDDAGNNLLVYSVEAYDFNVPHWVVASLAADRRTVSLYVDGELAGSGVAGTTVTLRNNSDLGLSIGGGINDSCNNVVIGPVAAWFGTIPSADRIREHYQAGKGTLVESSDRRFERLANYAGLSTVDLPAGLAEVGAQKTAGRTVIDVLREVGRTEGSPVFPTGSGALTFHARNHRYNASPALTVTSDDLEGEVVIRKDGQDFFNEITVERAGGASQRVANEVSQAGKAGRVDGGSFTVASSTDYDAQQSAAFQVGIHSEDRTRIPGLSIDLLSQDEAFQAQVLAVALGDLVEVTDLPSQSPLTDPRLFAEGGSGAIGVNDFRVSFNTSPNLPALLTLDDPVLGLLDSGNVIAW